MNIVRLTSGSYRARVYLGKDKDGKQIVKSITGPSKKAVQLEAAKLENEHRELSQKQTFAAAAEDYFVAMQPVLSPSTYKSYRSNFKMLEEKYGNEFLSLDVYTLTTKDAQFLINSLVQVNLSPKSIKNYWGMISSVLKYKDVQIRSPKLPQKERADIHVPDEFTVRRTLKAVAGTELEVPVLLAAFGPLRRGEICALMPGDISGNILHVQRDMVQDVDKVWRVKPPKSFTSDRYLEMPSTVMEKLVLLEPDEEGHLIHINPDMISHRFSAVLKAAGIEHYRFHDLRHFCASYLHAQGVPDIYIQQRTGHASPAILRQVYTHTLQDQSEAETEKIISYFSKMIV